MPRGRSPGLDRWAQKLGRQISRELAQVIARSVQRIVERSIDAGDLARQLGAGGARRRVDRPACSGPGCESPVLARGLCRSHYYKERYQSLKAGTLAPRRRKGRAGRVEETPAT